MDFTKLSIKRPITILMAALVTVLLGGVSLSKMHLDLMPSMDIPMAVVMTTYSGAGPEEVENMVTKPMEGALANVQNAKTIYSSSSQGSSMVMVEFEDGTDMDDATLWMRERIDLVKSALPDEVGTPTVLKMDMNSTPVAYLTVTSDRLGENELQAYVEDKILPQFQSLSGVASTSTSGGSEREIVVEINQERLEGLGLDMNTISQLLMAENFNQAGGTVDYGTKEFSISSKLQLQSVEDIKNMPIPLNSGSVLRLQDIATITEREKEATSISRVNGQNCMMVSITKASDANTVATVNQVKEVMEQINSEDQGIQCQLVTDQAEFIELAINGIKNNLLIGGLLAIIILFIFLKNIGLTAVIAVSMPLSVIATFVLLYFSGTTLNMISLGGLALGIGMMVDNSVVVIESIYRHRTTEGGTMLEGTYRGTKEVRMAVMASTLTTVVVFLPIVFASGIVMDIFKDMAMSVVFSLVASLVVSLTVVPMLCGNYVHNMHRNHAPKKLDFINKTLSGFDHGVRGLTGFYGKAMDWCLKRKKWVLIVTFAAFVGSLALIPFIGVELIPASDEGRISITLEAPTGTSLEELDRLTSQAEEYLLSVPQMAEVSVQSGGGSLPSSSAAQASITCSLVDKKDRKESTDEVADQIRGELSKIAGAEISVSSASSIMGSSSFGGSGINVEISGPELDVLEDLSNQMVEKISQIEGTREVTSSVQQASKEVAVRVDREKSSSYGLTGAQVASAIRTAVEGTVATTLKADGEEIDIRLSYPEGTIENVSDLSSIQIKSPMGSYVPLSAVAEIGLEDSPVSIARKDRERYITITGELFGRDTGSVSREIEKLSSQMTLPQGYTIRQGGQVEMMEDSFDSMALVLVLAVLLVYMVMAAQFESLLYPFIIMFTMPLAVTGSLILLFVTRQTISIPSAIGFLILAGIVVNNGIVLVDYINVLRREQGMEVEQAVKTAGMIRLRPILMTALTTILALLPQAFSQASGAEMERGMSIVVAGGLTASTVLTLVVVPILYLYFDKLSHRRKKGRHQKKALPQPQEPENFA